jgi:arylsulfatase A
VQAERPEIAERLTKLLEKYVASGRSTSGAAQPNNGSTIAIRRGQKPGGL